MTYLLCRLLAQGHWYSPYDKIRIKQCLWCGKMEDMERK